MGPIGTVSDPYITLNLAQNEEIDENKAAHCKWVLVVTELFDIAGNDFDTKELALCSWVLVITEQDPVLLCKQKTLTREQVFKFKNSSVYSISLMLQDSIRHNLSLNRYFVKAPLSVNEP